jgi:hypothetical protein
MSRNEFIDRANYSGQRVTGDVHWNPRSYWQLSNFARRRFGHYLDCAPLGAVMQYPSGLPDHTPAICGQGSYAKDA